VLFFLPAMNLGGIPPFSGFIGKTAVFLAGADVGTPLVWFVVAIGAVTSLLTLYALARVWNMAFWRGKEEVKDYSSPLLDQLEERPGGAATVTRTRTIPSLMTWATGGMVAVSIALTVFAGPLYEFSSRAGESLRGGDGYVETVFPDGAP
jgi:multicomponent Na+:H+ antiporter subunit D